MSQKKGIPSAVIGIGHLGRYHMEKYLDLPEGDLVGVVDSDTERAKPLADKAGVPFFSDTVSLLNAHPEIQAVSVVVPTLHHFEVVDLCLRAGADVLVEKPIAATVDEAEKLVKTAREQGRILQVGHVERFNPAFQLVKDEIKKPLFLEIHRLSPFPARSTDIDVMLDVMIHDVDLVLELVKSKVTDIKANGVPVLTDHIDIANARLEFENGTVANLTASRVSKVSARRFRLFEANHYLNLDLINGVVEKATRVSGENGQKRIQMERNEVGKQDHLKSEIQSFLQDVMAVRQGQAPSHQVAPGEAGLMALEVAVKIRTEAERTLSLMETPRP